MAALEDTGYYCVDNMPVALLPKFVELPMGSNPDIAGIAMVMDLRERSFLSEYTSVLEDLKRKGYRVEILFLEADEQVLVQRYSTTRRQHPLSHDKRLIDGIRTEKEQLNQLRAVADRIIDTSNFNVHELKAYILDLAQKSKKMALMRINILSFGFKYGVPPEVDLLIDVRFLPNPYFVPKLKALDGKSKKIQDFVLKKAETRKFLKKFFSFIDYLLPLYDKEGKSYLTLAVGCTGGRHRSVTIAQTIYDHVSSAHQHTHLTHRDINQAG
jgi:UPF0042 nucleotide-binding protein